MKKTKRHTIGYRRKREGKTNYKKRLNMLKSGKIRFVVRKSLNNLTVQLVEFSPKGDKVLASSHSRELEKYGWKAIRSNLPTAYLTGLLTGRKAVKKDIKEAILDAGFYSSIKGSKIYTAVKGALDAGLKINVDEKILPDEKRISGKHIADYKGNEKDNQFKKYEIDVSSIPKLFEDVKAKILKV